MISVISYVGPVLLMFISGFEVQRSFSRQDRKIAISFLLGATVIPFTIGILTLYVYNFAPYSGPNGNFMLFSTALKSCGALAVGTIIKRKRLASPNFAIALNARGGPGIVLATVAFDMGLISETLFVALVLTAIVTSLTAGFWLRYVKSEAGTCYRILIFALGPSTLVLKNGQFGRDVET